MAINRKRNRFLKKHRKTLIGMQHPAEISVPDHSQRKQIREEERLNQEILDFEMQYGFVQEDNYLQKLYKDTMKSENDVCSRYPYD